MSDAKNSSNPVPATAEPPKVTKIEGPTPSAGYAISFGPDGLIVKPAEATKKADDKKKMPRGSSVFRHA